jgi:hypothetical protein
VPAEIEAKGLPDAVQVTGPVLAPTVKTEPATSVTQTTATLNGSVNPNGAPVEECVIEYGETIFYGQSTACSPAPGSGSTAVVVTAVVSSLKANTTYDFRVVAKNAGGRTEGNNETFKTLSAPMVPTVKTEPATSVTQTTATLNGLVNPNGSAVEECTIEYGGTTSYGQSATCSPAPGSGTSPVVVSARISGLAASTNYHFRVSATNAAGRSNGIDEGFATLAASAPSSPQSIIPPAASGLPATGVLPFNARAAPVPDVKVVGRALAVDRSGSFTVTVTCPATETGCAGTITLHTVTAVSQRLTGHQRKKKAAILMLAVVPFNVAAGGTTRVRLRLSPAARVLLSSSHALRARSTIVARDPVGAMHTSQDILTLVATPSINDAIRLVHGVSVARKFVWRNPRGRNVANGVPPAYVGCRATSPLSFRCSFRSASGGAVSVYETVVSYAHVPPVVSAFRPTKTERHHEAEEAEINKLKANLEKELNKSGSTAEELIKASPEYKKAEAEQQKALAELANNEEELNKILTEVG